MPISRWPATGSGSGGSLYWGDAVATSGSLPTGVATGEIRLALDTQILYRWNGAAWLLYLDISTFALAADLASHEADTANPHATTKTQVGLGNADNTSDADKPVSTAQAAADSAVQAFAIQRANHTGTQAAGTITGLAAVATSGLKADVGLGNVDNTSDVNKPVSTAQAAADATTLASAQTYANTQIAALVASAPVTLDTLNELATALGNDPNFATTVSTALGNRLRVDTAAQGLNGTQKTNAKTNIDLQNVDNTSDATKNSATATLTNKIYDGGTASATSQLRLPKAGTAVLTALGRQQGALYYDTDLGKPVIDNGSSLSSVGSGSGGIPTSTTVTTYPVASAVGEYKEATRSSTISLPVANTGLLGDIDSGCSSWSDANATGLTLQPGVYDLQGIGFFSPQSGSIVVSSAYVGIGTAKQTATTGLDDLRNKQIFVGLAAANGQNFQITTPVWRVNVTTTTTYYLKGIVNFSGVGTTINVTGNLVARRNA